MGYKPMARHTWDGETAISGTDVLEVATIYKVYVRALFRALFRGIYRNIALKYMALYGSSSILGSWHSHWNIFRTGSMGATLTWDTRLSHDWVTWKLYLRPCGLRIQKKESHLPGLFFLVIASFGGLCWVMLGLLIREKWLLTTNKRAIVSFLSRKTLEPKSRKGREREREREWEDKNIS